MDRLNADIVTSLDNNSSSSDTQSDEINYNCYISPDAESPGIKYNCDGSPDKVSCLDRDGYPIMNCGRASCNEFVNQSDCVKDGIINPIEPNDDDVKCDQLDTKLNCNDVIHTVVSGDNESYTKVTPIGRSYDESDNEVDDDDVEYVYINQEDKIKEIITELDKLTPELKKHLCDIMALNRLYQQQQLNIIKVFDLIVGGDKITCEIEESIISLLKDLKSININ